VFHSGRLRPYYQTSDSAGKVYQSELMFVLGRNIQLSHMFVGKAKSLLKSGVHEIFFTQVGTTLFANSRQDGEACQGPGRHVQPSLILECKAKSLHRIA
jgi:hypothetical protein